MRGVYKLSFYFSVFISSVSTFVISSAADDFPQVKFNVSGLMPAVFTPLNDDQTVNLDVIPQYAAYLYNNGVKAVMVGGTSGEHMSLSVESRKKVIDAWVQAGDLLDLHIQAQVGGAPFADAIDLASYCQDIGVDSILTLPELYFKPNTIDELVSYVEMVSNVAPKLPILYYHHPKNSGVTLNMPEFVKAASARIPNFKGIKYTARDLVEAQQIVKALSSDQKFFLGGEALLAPAALLGIDSCVSPANNLFPGLMQSILDEIKVGRVSKARDLQNRLSSIIIALSAEGGRVAAMKVAMEIITGIKMGPPALPKQPVTKEGRKNIADKLMKFYH